MKKRVYLNEVIFVERSLLLFRASLSVTLHKQKGLPGMAPDNRLFGVTQVKQDWESQQRFPFEELVPLFEDQLFTAHYTETLHGPFADWVENPRLAAEAKKLGSLVILNGLGLVEQVAQKARVMDPI